MNIGIVSTWYATGAGNVSRSYEQILKKQHNIFIYARGNMLAKDKSGWDQTNVTWAPSHPCITGIYGLHFTSWIKRNSIDAILFNEQRHWAAVILAKKLGLLIGAYVDYYTAETVPLFDLFDFLICNTKRHYSVFEDHPQSCYCPWGTQTDTYLPSEKHITRPVTFIASAGWGGLYPKSAAWMDRRGTGALLKAFRMVTGECRLIVLSQAPLEKCPDDWQTAVREDDRIEFKEGTFEPTPYTLGDVYVYPSRLDGIGLTLPEALSCGLPAITTDSAPMNEFVRHGETGILVPIEDYRTRPDGYYWPESICKVDELVEALYFYIQDPDKVRLHGDNARAFAEENLSWEHNAAFLGEWITRQKRLSDREGVRIKQLNIEARRYDRRNNPTPLMKMMTGSRDFARQIFNYLLDWKKHTFLK